MRNKIFFKMLMFSFFLFASTAQALDKVVCADDNVECYLKQSQKLSLQAKLSSDSSRKRNLTAQGMNFAIECIRTSPKNPGCYYYRAVNQGLDLETRLIGVKQGLQDMMADFEKVIDLDKKYDNGGALRALGYVYLKLPSLPVLGSKLVKDMIKATDYSQKALAVAPNDPQNLQLAGEIAFENKDYLNALINFQSGLKALEEKTLDTDAKLTKNELLRWQMKTKNKLK